MTCFRLIPSLFILESVSWKNKEIFIKIYSDSTLLLGLQKCKLKGTILKISFKIRSSQWRWSMKKGVLKNIANFTEKRLC